MNGGTPLHRSPPGPPGRAKRDAAPARSRGEPRELLRAVFLLCALFGPALASAAADLLTRPHTVEYAGERVTLEPVPEPDLSQVEPEVRKTLDKQRADTAEALEKRVSRRLLAQAFGKLGEAYHAHHVYIPAGPAYRNAQRLDPANPRWSYLLGYLGEQTTELEQSVAAYRRVLELQPDNEHARLRLALVLLDLNRDDEAAALLERPFTDPALQPVADYALGRVALKRHRFEEAARRLERFLAAQPQASRAYYPLAMAYRGLGETDKARSVLARFGDGRVQIPDPMVDYLDGLMRGGLARLHQGLVALLERRYEDAVAAWGQALKLNPDNVPLRVSHARALFLAGEEPAARRELAEALRRDPSHPLANFMMGLLRQKDGDLEDASAHYDRAIAAEPDHAGAHYFKGLIEYQRGDYAQAARDLEVAAKASVRNHTARLYQALALLRAGAGHARVRRLLEEAHEAEPDNALVTYVLTRLLATSPDPRARDGKQALALAQSLMEKQPSPPHEALLAMALAETGDYDAALTHQTRVIAAALGMGRLDLLPELQRCLDAYQKKRPCRGLWPETDPVWQTPPLNIQGPFRDYPTPEPY